MDFRKIRIMLVCLSGLTLAAPAVVHAGADSGFYIGGGIGSTTIDQNNFDASDSSYKVFGGYNIGFIPLVDFALEASYVDFGKPATNNSSIDMNGVDAFGLAGLSFGPFGIFVKAGVIDWDLDSSINGTSTSESGSDPAYGLGARFSLGSIAIRLEYEVFDIDSDNDVSMSSASVVYTF
jgi:hypothetical protein